MRGTLTMRVSLLAVLVLAAALGCSRPAPAADGSAPAPVSAREAAQKAYPADLGAREVYGAPGLLPEAQREGYVLVKTACGGCHPASRPLHHRYAEPEGRDVPDKEAFIASLKKERPEFFKEPLIWQVEADVWKRCVARMAGKPSSGIAEGDLRPILSFLVWDSGRRKLGKGAAAWRASRRALLERFKAEQPRRYAELLADDSL
ncbi:MAG: hypothetical protein HY924_00930 [Elusimicrobia bacterium]|nr:hypothetical protein [Elusimicrobiota bacterium]